jgi:hypothetical protein
MSEKEFSMKNIYKSKVSSILGIAAIMVVIGFSLSSCISMLTKIGMGIAKNQYKNHGVFDNSVPADQQSELRFLFVNIKSFNGRPVAWGDKANNHGFVKVPAGRNTIIFDWVKEDTDSDIVYNHYIGHIYIYTTTTSSIYDITFPDVEMLPGHNYFIAAVEGNDDLFRVGLLDLTYTPSGFFGDTVSDPPKESKTATEFEGTWKNIYDDSFAFAGNTWIQTFPPMTESNTGQNEVRIRGTFEVANGYITMYATGTSIDGGRWLDTKAMKQAYIWKYSVSGNNLLLELPYLYPEMAYLKQ